MINIHKRNFWLRLGYLYLLLLLYLSLSPKVVEYTPPVPSFDKGAHLSIYSFAACYFLLLLPERKWKILVVLTLYGITIELIQPYTGRSFELLDILFNSLGIWILGPLLCRSPWTPQKFFKDLR